MAVVSERIGSDYSFQVIENPNGGFFVKERRANQKDFRFTFNYMGGPRIKRYDTFEAAFASANSTFDILN